jgi:hypothetical protein
MTVVARRQHHDPIHRPVIDEHFGDCSRVRLRVCRFYARQGCVLSEVLLGACPNLPDEIQLLWRKNLPES